MNSTFDTEFAEETPQQQGNLGEMVKEYLGLLRRYFWLILILTTLSTGGAVWWTFSQVPVYQSTTGVVVERAGPKIMETSQDLGQRMETSEMVTHLKLMTSFPVLQEAVGAGRFRPCVRPATMTLWWVIVCCRCSTPGASRSSCKSKLCSLARRSGSTPISAQTRNFRPISGSKPKSKNSYLQLTHFE